MLGLFTPPELRYPRTASVPQLLLSDMGCYRGTIPAGLGPAGLGDSYCLKCWSGSGAAIQ